MLRGITYCRDSYGSYVFREVQQHWSYEKGTSLGCILQYITHYQLFLLLLFFLPFLFATRCMEQCIISTTCRMCSFLSDSSTGVHHSCRVFIVLCTFFGYYKHRFLSQNFSPFHFAVMEEDVLPKPRVTETSILAGSFVSCDEHSC